MKSWSLDSALCGLAIQLLTVSNRSVEPFSHSTSSIAPEWFLLLLRTKPRGSICHSLPSVPRSDVKISSTMSQSVVITSPLVGGGLIPTTRAGSVLSYHGRSPIRCALSSATPPVDFPPLLPASHIRCLNAPARWNLSCGPGVPSLSL